MDGLIWILIIINWCIMTACVMNLADDKGTAFVLCVFTTPIFAIIYFGFEKIIIRIEKQIEIQEKTINN